MPRQHPNSHFLTNDGLHERRLPVASAPFFSDMDIPSPGQRWVSNSEPELGIGVIGKAEYGRVQMFFPAAQQARVYAMASAPLRRVRFAPGDTVKTHDGRSLNVTEDKPQWPRP